jgi:hypothetical protein
MKNAWMILTMSIEMYKLMGTMFWNETNDDLTNAGASQYTWLGRMVVKTHAKMMIALTTVLLDSWAPIS